MGGGVAGSKSGQYAITVTIVEHVRGRGSDLEYRIPGPGLKASLTSGSRHEDAVNGLLDGTEDSDGSDAVDGEVSGTDVDRETDPC